MSRLICAALIALAVTTPVDAGAQDSIFAHEEYSERIRADTGIAALESGLFGDRTDSRNGQTSFQVVDLRVPGVGPDVVVSRSYEVAIGNSGPQAFGNWEFDIPHLRGVFPKQTGWQVAGGSPTSRCSAAFPDARAPTVQGQFTTEVFEPYQYGHAGVHLNVYGATQELLHASASTLPIAGLQARWVTSGDWAFTCLASVSGGAGEGFVGHAPDGTKYYFDWMSRSKVPGIKQRIGTSIGSSTRTVVERDEVRLYPTRVVDRFGNWLSFEYRAVGSHFPSRITASDGRVVNVDYGPDGLRVQSITHAGKAWRYQYSAEYWSDLDQAYIQVSTPTSRWLSSVVLPDGTSWVHDTRRVSPGSKLRQPSNACAATLSESQIRGTPGRVEIKSPSGAIGVFQFQWTRHGRTGVPDVCQVPGTFIDGSGDYTFPYPVNYEVISLVSKTLSGTGIPSGEWRYQYESSWSNWGPAFNRTIVSEPARRRVLSYGNRFGIDDGLLLREEIQGLDSMSFRTLENVYPDMASRQGRRIGRSVVAFADPLLEVKSPTLETILRQDGLTFRTNFGNFDPFSRARSIEATGTGGPKLESLEYYDHVSMWVLGQVARATVAGTEVMRKEYDTLARPWRLWRFGQPIQRVGYGSDGTIAWVADAKNQTVYFNSWYRGTPRSVTYPDGTSQSAAVSPEGWLTSITDQNGATTTYGRDLAGRLTRIDYPTGDAVAWAPSVFSLTQSSATVYGLPAGHWQWRKTEGNRTNITFLDALFRPVVEETYDAANASGTRSVVVRRYDQEGRLIFQSHPQRSITSVTGSFPGLSTAYDALDRVTSTNNAGRSTTVQYLAGGQRRTINPRGNAVTESFLMHDAPSYDWPTAVVLPEGVSISIERDVFGKPRTIKRSGGGVELTREYLYDSAQRLCRQNDPETGATFFQYDAANNVAWRATVGEWLTKGCGPSLPSIDQRTQYSYDAMNRLTAVDYPGAAVDTSYTYTSTGRLARATAGSNVTTYQYNRRGMPTLENYNYPGAGDYPHRWEYDALGNLAAEVTISDVRLDYAPNALGQATRSGSYATNARYDAAGRLLGFTYGNGITRSYTYNAWGEPSRISDVGGSGVDLSYSYDGHGNISGITDNTGGLLTRNGFSYDGLDRLRAVNNPGGFGAASYTYDSLDNLKTATLAGNTLTYNYASATNRLTSITNSAGGLVNNLGYDAFGNITSNNSRQHRFDAANRMTEAVGVARYEYDAHGRRTITWRQDGTGKNDVYTQDGVLRYTSDNALQGGRVHIYLGGLPIAEQFRRWDGTGTTNLRYLHTDALRSVVAGTGANREVLLSPRTYQPYGKTPQTLWDRAGYTYHMEDRGTDLVYMQQRYYDPSIGRFLSVDPVGPLSNPINHFGRYHYANNNPYKYVDPDGRVAGLAIKFIRKTIKHRGNVIEATFDVGGDVVTVFAPSSTPFERLEGAVSLISPVNFDDVRSARRGLEALGVAGGGRKGGLDTRAQNLSIANTIDSRGGAAQTGAMPGVPEGRFAQDGRVRYSDISATDRDGRPFEVQTVDTNAAGELTARERSAAIDIAEMGDRPVVCVSKASCE